MNYLGFSWRNGSLVLSFVNIRNLYLLAVLLLFVFVYIVSDLILYIFWCVCVLFVLLYWLFLLIDCFMDCVM